MNATYRLVFETLKNYECSVVDHGPVVIIKNETDRQSFPTLLEGIEKVSQYCMNNDFTMLTMAQMVWYIIPNQMPTYWDVRSTSDNKLNRAPLYGTRESVEAYKTLRYPGECRIVSAQMIVVDDIQFSKDADGIIKATREDAEGIDFEFTQGPKPGTIKIINHFDADQTVQTESLMGYPAFAAIVRCPDCKGVGSYESETDLGPDVEQSEGGKITVSCDCSKVLIQ